MTEAWQQATAAGAANIGKSIERVISLTASLRDTESQQLNIMQKMEALRIKGTEGEEAKLRFLNANVAAAGRLLKIDQQIEDLNNANARQSVEGSADRQARADRMSEIKDSLESEDKGLKQNPFKSIEFFAGPAKERISAMQTELASLMETTKAEQQLIQDRKDKIADLKTLIPLVDKLNSLENDSVVKENSDAEAERIKKVIEEKTKAQQTLDSIIKKARDESIKEDEKIAAEKEKREKDMNKRMGALRSSILQKQLKADGKDVEAQIEGLKQKFALDFLKAEGLVEKGLLGQQLALDIKDAKNVEAKDPERQDIRGRFEDMVSKLKVSDKDAKIARAQERKERREMRQLATLEAIRDIAKDNKELLGDIDFDPRFQ